MRTLKLFRICILPVIASFLALSACDKQETKAPPEKTINVTVRQAEKKAIRPYVEATGTLNPFEEVIVSSEIEGILKEVKVDEGVAVSKGMLLAVIDNTDYALEVKRAQAALHQTEATVANTKVEYKRKETLLKEELVTQQQFDDVATRLSLAEAEVERAKASLSLAQERLKKTKIYSPLTGFVKVKKISRGDFVKNGTNLFAVIQTSQLKLNFTVPEKDVGRLAVGQDVTLKVDAFKDKEFSAKVFIVYPNIEEKTRTLQVEARVPNERGILKPGFFTKVILYTGQPREAILVPIIAPLFERDVVRIFVVNDNRAKERKVVLGNKYGEMIEIIEGIKEQEGVVVAGQQNLAEGVKVNVAR